MKLGLDSSDPRPMLAIVAAASLLAAYRLLSSIRLECENRAHYVLSMKATSSIPTTVSTSIGPWSRARPTRRC